MIELLEKTLLAGMGAVALSQKKAEELLEDLKERFDVSEEEGKAFLEKLQQTAKDNQKKLEDLAHEEVRKSCERLGVASAEDLEKLAKRVARLEELLEDKGA